MVKKVVLDIVMLSNFGSYSGGRETWLYNFLPELLNDNTISKVHLYGFRTEGQEDHSAKLKNLDPLNLGRIVPIILSSKPNRYPKFIKMYFLLRNYLKNNQFEHPTHVLAVGGMLETLIVRFTARFINATRVVWLRSIFTHEKAYRIPSYGMNWVKLVEKNNLRKTADIIIANGDDTKKFYDTYGLPIFTLKNAVNIDSWRMPTLAASHVMEVVFMGRLSKVKGIEYYFELAKRIKNSSLSSNFNFHVIGESFNYEEITTTLHNEGILKYHGPISNEKLPAYLKSYHVCVALTFESDELGGAGLSNALIEQMAAGKIIVAWDNNIFNQILNDNCAYMVKQYNLDLLEKTLLTIYNEQEIALKKGCYAKEIIKPYTMENHVKMFKDILNLNP